MTRGLEMRASVAETSNESPPQPSLDRRVTTDSRGKHRIQAELKQLEQEARFLEASTALHEYSKGFRVRNAIFHGFSHKIENLDLRSCGWFVVVKLEKESIVAITRNSIIQVLL
ncbi:hypothetical protein EJ110_NYTH27236 [Nymphaea thermarum]|nr:hypothetical protein EJ110_NYTH27236 [Nymphaea thermarum]